MTTLILTLVGDDRTGLVSAVADLVDDHGGSWENSQLAELAGAFAGVVEVSVPSERADDLRVALTRLEGILTVAVHAGAGSVTEPTRRITLKVLGNDHPGIVRDVSAALQRQGLSIDRMTTATTDAAMSGGRLFEATVIVRVPVGVDLAQVTAEVERVAAEIQVDTAVTEST